MVFKTSTWAIGYENIIWVSTEIFTYRKFSTGIYAEIPLEMSVDFFFTWKLSQSFYRNISRYCSREGSAIFYNNGARSV